MTEYFFFFFNYINKPLSPSVAYAWEKVWVFCGDIMQQQLRQDKHVIKEHLKYAEINVKLYSDFSHFLKLPQT